MGTFWLQVKESYIIENFSALVKYLCNYVAPIGIVDHDFEATYECLRKVAHEHCDRARRSINLFEQHIPGNEVIDYDMLVKLASASILTSQNLKRTEDYVLMLSLANILLLRKRNMSADTCTDFLEFVKACIEQRKITQLGLTWRSLDCSIDMITEHLLNTKWAASTDESPIHYFEQNALAVIDHKSITISTQNFDTWSKGKLQTVLPIPYDINVKSVATDRLKASATPLDVITKTSELLLEMSQFKPSLQKMRHDCVVGMTTTVQIVRKQFNIIIARTVDPRFNPIEGRVILNSYQLVKNTLLSKDEIYQRFNVGDYLVVKFTNTVQAKFELENTVFNDFYAREAAFICDSGEDVDSIFVTDFKGGTRWLSADGILLNVSEAGLSAYEQEEINTAIDEGQALPIRAIGAFSNDSANTIVNAKFCSRSGSEPYPTAVESEFRKNAMASLLEDFHEFCSAEFESLPTEATEVRLHDTIGLVVASRTLFKLSEQQDTTMDRVKVLAAAILLAECCGQEMGSDKAFMQHEMKFLECGIKFVRGDSNPSTLELHHSDIIDGVPEVTCREQVVKVLGSYKQEDDLAVIPQSLSSTDANAIVESIGKLVEASNILRGKIQAQSLARIKAEIAKCLELDDEYIPKVIDSNLTYYGVESDTIEFKSSIVIPPCNRQNRHCTADPDIQRWAIIKTICGFLNSHDGGELYIGVRDNGYACGIQSDMDELFKLGKITISAYDNYRRYVKEMLDVAFQTFDKKYKETDITTDPYIKYDYITNKEHLDIMRIRVKPFPKDAVRIYLPRPDWVAESYVRTSGATVPLSDAARKSLSDHRHK